MSRIYRTLGTVAMTPKGEYSSSAYYEKLNIVTYNGSSYVALQNTHGNLPTNTTYWQLLAQKGAKTYNNVAEMKADTDLTDGMVAETLGYYSANDGGAATYKITDEENQDEYQEELENSLYATLITGNEINVLKLGIKMNDITFTNNASILQEISNKYDNIVLYFPLGTYHFFSEILINNDITLKGFFKGKPASSDSYESSVLYYHATTPEKTFITQSNTSWQLNLENLTIYTQSGTWADRGLSDGTVPYSQYTYTPTIQDINGIQYSHSTSVIKNICVDGFSGYGLQASRMQIYDSYFKNCGNCIELLDNDISLYNCYITQSNNGIYSQSQKNLMMYDCYIDLLAGYGVYIEGYLSGIIDAYFDHINYAGIVANGINSFNGKIKCYRTGMYYSGETITNLKNATLETEIDNFSKASGICCKGELKNSLINLDSISLNNSDSGSSSKTSPVACIYLRYNNGSLINTQNNDLIVVRTYTTQTLFTNTNSGLNRYGHGNICNPTYLIKKSYAATGNMAHEVGDLWLNTNNGKLWIATAISSNTTTWKEITYTE